MILSLQHYIYIFAPETRKTILRNFGLYLLQFQSADSDYTDCLTTSRIAIAMFLKSVYY